MQRNRPSPAASSASAWPRALAFGALIAIAGCRVGLRAGRSAADVGQATATTAVVASVVGVIALDAIFALCANALGI